MCIVVSPGCMMRVQGKQMTGSQLETLQASRLLVDNGEVYGHLGSVACCAVQ